MAEGKWRLEYIFICYDLAKAGLSEAKTAETIGITRQTLREWRIKHPLLDKAIKYAKRTIGENGMATFKDYVFMRLPKHLKSLWRELEAYGSDVSTARIETLMKDQGKRARQHLFVHALISHNFNISEACRRVGVSYAGVVKWQQEESFRELMHEMQQHKKNFFESALVNLVKQGDSAATIFANKTLNRDRGYSDKVQIEHTHTHTHAMVAIDQLDLPLDVRKLILDKIREKQGDRLPLALQPANHDRDDDDVVDAEVLKITRGDDEEDD